MKKKLVVHDLKRGISQETDLLLKRDVVEDTDCSRCIHSVVCDRSTEKRCENYTFGTSAGKGCNGCVHRHARYAPLDAHNAPVRCFSCPSFEERKPIATYLPMDCPVCGRRRLELLDEGRKVRCEKCTTASEDDGFTVDRYVGAVDDLRAYVEADGTGGKR